MKSKNFFFHKSEPRGDRSGIKFDRGRFDLSQIQQREVNFLRKSS